MLTDCKTVWKWLPLFLFHRKMCQFTVKQTLPPGDAQGFGLEDVSWSWPGSRVRSHTRDM